MPDLAEVLWQMQAGRSRRVTKAWLPRRASGRGDL